MFPVTARDVMHLYMYVGPNINSDLWQVSIFKSTNTKHYLLCFTQQSALNCTFLVIFRTIREGERKGDHGLFGAEFREFVFRDPICTVRHDCQHVMRLSKQGPSGSEYTVDT